MWLAVEAGQGCEGIMDEKMRGLTSKRIQVDEIWSHVGKHQRVRDKGIAESYALAGRANSAEVIESEGALCFRRPRTVRPMEAPRPSVSEQSDQSNAL